MCQVTVLLDVSVFVQATNSRMADISGSVSITLCGVEAPDSAGVPLNVLAVPWLLGKCLSVLRRVCLVMGPDQGSHSHITCEPMGLRALEELYCLAKMLIKQFIH